MPTYSAVDQAAAQFSTLSVQQPFHQPPVSASKTYQPRTISQHQQPHGGCCEQVLGSRQSSHVKVQYHEPSGIIHQPQGQVMHRHVINEPLTSIPTGQGANFHQQNHLQYQYVPTNGVAKQYSQVHHQYPGNQIQQCTERRDRPAIHRNVSQQQFYSSQPIPRNLGHGNVLHNQPGSRKAVVAQSCSQNQEQQPT